MIDYNGKIEAGHIVATIVATLLIGIIAIIVYCQTSPDYEITNCVLNGGGHSCYTDSVRLCKKKGGGDACDRIKQTKLCLANGGGDFCISSTLAHREAVLRCKKHGGGKSCNSYK
jgi:hypothetical protein